MNASWPAPNRLVCAFEIAAILFSATRIQAQEWQSDSHLELSNVLIEPESSEVSPDSDSVGDIGSLDLESSGGCCECYCDRNSFMEELTCRLEAMAARGIVYDIERTQFYQGVTSGGTEQKFEYGGKVDQFLILDGGKLGFWDGMTMTMHVETRFGQDVNFEAVGLAPVNVAMLYPNFNEHDTAITGLSFAQAVDQDTQVTFGKFNALDLFNMLYPQTGRGIDGFMNASMVVPISVARVVPQSFMGAGALQLHGKQVQSGVLVYDTQNVTTTSGFDDMFDNGANILGFYRFFTNMGGMPGSHLIGGIWSTGEFTSFDSIGLAIVPGQGLVVDRENGAYTLLYIFEQTLWASCCNKNRNISVLSQWGLADDDTSPFDWSCNVGIQATGFSRSRPADSIGIGYFHTGLGDNFKQQLAPLFNLQDIDGVEVYYNAAVAKCFHLTADLQVIEPADASNDTAVVFGLRGTFGL